MIRVALVDDHELVRAGFERILATFLEIEVVGSWSGGEQALRALRRSGAEVLLTDVSMPGMNGVELTRRVKRLAPEVRVVGLSEHREGPFPSCMMDVGACGYLTKNCAPAELLRAIEMVHAGRRYVSAEVAQSMILKRMDGGQNELEALAPRELEVMVMLSEGRSLRQISDRLCVSPKTVSTYRTRIMRKLGTGSNVELTHMAFRHGLIQPLPAG